MDYSKYKDSFKTYYEQFPGKKLFRLQVDDVTKSLRITSSREDLFLELQKAFSVDNPGAFYSERYGYAAAKKLFAINKFGYFAPGLVKDILDWIKLQYGSLDCVAVSQNCAQFINEYMTPLKSVLKDQTEISNIAEDVGRNDELRRLREKQLAQGIPEKECVHPFEYREYQEEAVKSLLYKGLGRGMIEIPTAGGKSLIIANYIWNMVKKVDRNLKFLIFVPNTQLVEQFYKDLVDYGFHPLQLCRLRGGMTAKQKRESNINNASIIIANRQYAFKNLDAIPKCDALICDEVHTTKASTTLDVISNMDCKYKIGCSGTLPTDKYEMWKIAGVFGKVVYREQIQTLQSLGFISKLKITLLHIIDKAVDDNKDLLFNVDSNKKYITDEYGFSDIQFNEAYNAEHEYFAKNYKDLYKPVFDYLLKMQENTLILFDRIEIGRNLFEYAKELYAGLKNVFYIDGTTDVKDREQIRVEFEKEDGNMLIAQVAVMSTGVNIKRLTNIVFLTGSKSFSQVVQSIGRTLRLHFNKNEAHLIDCSWRYKYSKKHLDERLKIYKEQYGKKYDEKIIVEI